MERLIRELIAMSIGYFIRILQENKEVIIDTVKNNKEVKKLIGGKK